MDWRGFISFAVLSAGLVGAVSYFGRPNANPGRPDGAGTSVSNEPSREPVPWGQGRVAKAFRAPILRGSYSVWGARLTDRSHHGIMPRPILMRPLCSFGESLFVDFNNVSTTGTITNPAHSAFANPLKVSEDLSAHLARVGLNFGF